MAEACEEFDLNKTFLSATEFVRSIVGKLSENDMLAFYSFYKQATSGPCNRPKPSWYQMTEKQKWQAWASLQDMDCTTAMKKYLELLDQIDSDWTSKVKDEYVSQSWVSHSSLMCEDEHIEDVNKTVFDWVKENNLDMTLKLIKEKNIDVNSTDDEGLTLLHWAADRGYIDIVKHLISNLKMDVNLVDSSGQTALHYASCCGHFDIITYLLQNGADSKIKDEDGSTAYDLAESESVKSIFDQLV